MLKKHRSSPPNTHESFSDIALLMLATLLFLFVTILITTKSAQQNELPKLKQTIAELQADLAQEKDKNVKLLNNMDSVINMTSQSSMEAALQSAGFGKNSKNRKDFDLFVKGIKDLPGDSLHLMLDATGSMHGATNFLVPILRVIVIRSGKRLDALSWYSDAKTVTYRGTMGSIFDSLMNGAPFIGSDETIGKAFRDAAKNAPKPGAYVLIGDEPSTDKIHYFYIPAPVFTIPLGKSDPETNWAFQKLADETGGKMLRMELK